MMRFLFLCTHNACRSILAEATLRHLGKDRIAVASAGSHPSGIVHPRSLALLQSEGISIAGLFSKSWEELSTFQPDVVITVCDQAAGESCPIWLGKTLKAHWGVADPSAVAGDEADNQRAFLATYWQLRGYIEALLALPFEQYNVAQLKNALDDIAVRHREAEA